MLNAMIGLQKKVRQRVQSSARLQAIRTYLLAILAFTLVLFSLSLVALVSQQQASRELSRSTLRFASERVALDIERKVEALANACLDPDNLKTVHYSPGDEHSPEKMRALRKAFNALRTRYPIAQHFFLFSGGRLVFPGVAVPQMQSIESMAADEPALWARQYATLIKGGEDAESGTDSRKENAIRMYRRAEELPVALRLMALASFRAAQVQQKIEGTVASVPAYQAFVKVYADEYNQFLMPYGLALALDSNDLASRVFPSYSLVLRGLYRDVIRGRWELSALQADYVLAQIELRLGLKPDARPHSEFLDHLALARAAEGHFPANPDLQPGEVRAREFKQGDKVSQILYARLPAPRGNNVVAGFSVSAPWIRAYLLPDSMSEQPATSKVPAYIEDVSGSAGARGATDDLYIPLGADLSPWMLHVPTSSIQSSAAAAYREQWFLAAASAMFLCILGIGMYLLIRVSGDIHWFQVRSDFVSGVSHELKTPLSLIRLYSETLADGEQNYPPEERHGYIRIIARESERLSRLIDNVLDFSKIEQGRKRLELQEADLTVIVKQTVEDYSEYLFLRGFSVKMAIQPGLPPVKFNREQVSQMILNLMDNARKYSDKSRVIRVNMWREKAGIVLEVQDHGFGIPVSEQEKIFEPFYRVPRGGEKGGCGLGLYLVRDVIQGHGGRVEVLSEVGKGSRFRLHFPIGKAAQGSYKETEGMGRESLWEQAEI